MKIKFVSVDNSIAEWADLNQYTLNRWLGEM